jgi:hypothetical protein
MSLAHAPRNRIAAVYNVNRYLAERKIMLQCWADMLDAWVGAVAIGVGIGDLQRVEIIGSCGEVKDLIGRLLGEGGPTIDLSHCDLP